MSYKHLTIEERSCIALYWEKGLKISEIAELLGRNKSTISREIKRNKNNVNKYNPVGAQRKYNKRRKKCKRHKILENKEIYNQVKSGIEKYWSPEQAIEHLDLKDKISVSTIYRAFDNKMFDESVRKKLRRYGKRLKRNKTKIKGKAYDFSEVRTISKRPAYIELRQEEGHWELDTVVLRKECGCHIATFVERKTRFAIFVRLKNKSAKEMGDAIIRTFKKLPGNLVRTLTVDRGLEFTDWKRIEKELNTKVYFCDPYSPQQRGTNENTNGLLRQFFPRKTLLPPVTDEYLLYVQNLINNRPRKVLNFMSPYQLFSLHLT